MKLPLQSIYNWYRNAIRNPKYRWWIVLATFTYLIFPFDISPDFFPIFGEIDDIFLVTILVTELSQIAIEHFKSRPSQETATTPQNAGETVEVKAISLD